MIARIHGMFLGDEHVLKFGSGDGCNLWVADTTGSDTLKQWAAWCVSNSLKHKSTISPFLLLLTIFYQNIPPEEV